MSQQDLKFIEQALKNPWMFWVYFWKWPRIVRQACAEYDLLAKDRDAAKAAHDQSVKANDKLLKWVYVTHNLEATSDLRAIFTAGKRLSILILFLCFGLSANAAPAPSSTWVLYKWGNSGKYIPYSTVDGAFSFPQTGRNVAYPAFLTTTTDTSVLGDLTGRTVTATLDLDVTGNPQFRYGGQGVWNFGSLPANTRLFISTSSAPYSNAGYKSCPSCFWWSAVAWVQISATTGTVTLQDSFNPAHWSNAQGQLGSSLPGEFAAAISSVRQIGLAYGGGSFYDVGIAITNGTGTAIFHLVGFNVQ